MEKSDYLVEQTPAPSVARWKRQAMLLLVGIAALLTWGSRSASLSLPIKAPSCHHDPSPYGRFPKPDDPFQFLPCTSETLPPTLEDKHPEKTWAGQYDPNPDHWSWGNATTTTKHDKHHGRGIYLCGYLDVPLDYTNESDSRIVRLAVNKYQVSGLAKVNDTAESVDAGRKSERTIVLNPGGPGGSGISYRGGR